MPAGSTSPMGLAIGVATQLLVLPLLYLPIFLLTGTDSDELSEPARELADRAGSLPSWLLFAVLVGVCAPVVEELFYRGLFLRSLTKRGLSPVVAVLVSSAVFAAIHFQVLQFAGLFAFGLIAGTLAARSGRLGPSIWAHIGFNMTTVVLLYLSRLTRAPTSGRSARQSSEGPFGPFRAVSHARHGGADGSLGGERGHSTRESVGVRRAGRTTWRRAGPVATSWSRSP